MEKTEGDNYRARIYPVPAKGYKRVVIATLETVMPGSETSPYKLAIDYGEVSKFSFEVRVQGPSRSPVLQIKKGLKGLDLPDWQDQWHTEVSAADFDASGLIELRIPKLIESQAFTQTIGTDTYFYAPLDIPAFDKIPRAKPKRIGLIWDASGSAGKRDHTTEIAFLDQYFEHTRNVEVHLECFRHKAESVQVFSIRNGEWDELRTTLEEMTYDGGTSLGSVEAIEGVDCYFLFSDGLSNFGKSEFKPNNAEIYAISSTLSADHARLKGLAYQSGGAHINLERSPLETAVEMALYEQAKILSVSAVSGGQVSEVFPALNTPVSSLLELSGKLVGGNATIEVVVGGEGLSSKIIRTELDANTASSGLVGKVWASDKVESLQIDRKRNREEILLVGREFGLVVDGTSLIVLETLADYLTYEIKPPAELLPEWQKAIEEEAQFNEQELQAHMEYVLEAFKEKQEWHATDYSLPLEEKKTTIAPEIEPESSDTGKEEDFVSEGVVSHEVGSVPLEDTPISISVINQRFTSDFNLSEIGYLSSVLSNFEEVEGSTVTITLVPPTKKSKYSRRYAKSDDHTLYSIYLDERLKYAKSTSFYLDSFNVFMDRGQSEMALRILSNLAEFEFENHELLRILGYRLLQAGHSEEAIQVLERLLVLREEEPQSYRDLALAHAATGNIQKAIELLWHVVKTPWDDRFYGIQMIALTELNELAARRDDLDLSEIDPQLLHNLPVDLRVVMTWDADNTDIDLWVTDPSGEKCYYGNSLTKDGGRMSEDLTDGYGPEVFMLRDAMPGKYKIEVEYFGTDRQVLTDKVTIQVDVQRNFGQTGSASQSVTHQLESEKETVFIGEFIVE